MLFPEGNCAMAVKVCDTPLESPRRGLTNRQTSQKLEITGIGSEHDAQDSRPHFRCSRQGMAEVQEMALSRVQELVPDGMQEGQICMIRIPKGNFTMQEDLQQVYR